MASGVKAIVRQHVEAVSGVTRTWFEHTHIETGWEITLVVEVAETDPNLPGFDPNLRDQIYTAASNALNNHTTMIVQHLRIVPLSR